MKKLMLTLILGGIIMTNINGCAKNEETTTSQKKAEIEQSFNKVLAMYSTKNLMDFYDMEGYRDENFEKSDKGVWVLQTRMAIESSEKDELLSEGMVLRMDRNTRTARGFYFINKIQSPNVEKQEYPVTYDENGFHLMEAVSDIALKTKIENFRFFVQYSNFQKLDQYKNLRKMYNPEVPNYELEYQLTNEDPNVQALRQRYDIPTDKAPTMLLKGRGNLEGSVVGYKTIEIRFSKNPPIIFRDSIDFQPVTEEDKR